MALEYNDVKDALEQMGVTRSEFEYSDVVGGVAVRISEDEIGQFQKVNRTRLGDVNVTQRRLGDTLVAHIPSEEPKGLGQLFG